MRQTSSWIGRPGIAVLDVGAPAAELGVDVLDGGLGAERGLGEAAVGVALGVLEADDDRLALGLQRRLVGALRSDMKRPAPVPSASSIELSIAGQPALPVRPCPSAPRNPPSCRRSRRWSPPRRWSLPRRRRRRRGARRRRFVSPSLPHAAIDRRPHTGERAAFHTVPVLIGLPRTDATGPPGPVRGSLAETYRPVNYFGSPRGRGTAPSANRRGPSWRVWRSGLGGLRDLGCLGGCRGLGGRGELARSRRSTRPTRPRARHRRRRRSSCRARRSRSAGGTPRPARHPRRPA